MCAELFATCRRGDDGIDDMDAISTPPLHLSRSSVSDARLYEQRLRALIGAFNGVELGPETRCLRQYHERLVQILALHTALRRRTSLDAKSFATKVVTYCDLALMCHAALLEIGRNEALRKRLALAGTSSLSAGMSGRQLFCEPLEQPRFLSCNPPFNARAAVDGVARFIDVVKTDMARLDALVEIEAQVFVGERSIVLSHPTRTLISRSHMSRITPLHSRVVIVFHLSDILLGARYDANDRILVDFVIDLYGATIEPMQPLAASCRNVRDGDCVILKSETETAMATWIDRVGHLTSTLKATRAQWMPDISSTRCVQCLRRFRPISRRRHHCRRCGALVCADCSPQMALLPSNDPHKKKRLCIPCVETRSHVGKCPVSSFDLDLIRQNLLAIEASIARKLCTEDFLIVAKAHESDVLSVSAVSLDDVGLMQQFCDLLRQLRTIARLSSELQAALSTLVDTWKEDQQQQVGAVLSHHACLFAELSTYVAEVNEISEMPSMARVLETGQQALPDTLVGPLRRIPNLWKACSKILEATPEAHADHAGLALVVRIIADCSSAATDCIARMEGSVVIADIESRFCDRISLFRPGRIFITEGIVLRTQYRNKPYRILLFSDLLLVCKETPAGLVPRWRIDTRVHPLAIGKLSRGVLQLTWLSMSFTFESDDAERWFKEIERVSKQLRVSGRSVVKANEWVPDGAEQHCNLCRKSFGLIVRRHHCRSCGVLTCHQCSLTRVSLTFGSDKSMRVCDRCRPGEPNRGAVITADVDSDGDNEVDDSDDADPMSRCTSIFEHTSITLPKDHWMGNADSKQCLICDNMFNLGRRRHHCRECGCLCCKSCSKSRLIVERCHPNDRVRVCDRCATEVRERQRM